MLFLMTFFLSLIAIAADFIHFWRNRRRHVPRRKALIAWAAATDALPVISSVISAAYTVARLIEEASFGVMGNDAHGIA